MKSGWGLCDNNKLDKSKEYIWENKVLKNEENKIMVGVASKDFDINSSLHDNCGWYYYLYDYSLISESSKDIKLKYKLDSRITKKSLDLLKENKRCYKKNKKMSYKTQKMNVKKFKRKRKKKKFLEMIEKYLIQKRIQFKVIKIKK